MCECSDDRRPPVLNSDLKLICLILNTAEYCGNTIGQLEEKITEIVDEDFKSQISFSDENEAFLK
jgi:hypothetical protein